MKVESRVLPKSPHSRFHNQTVANKKDMSEATKTYLLFIESNTTGSGVEALHKAYELGLEPVLFTRDATRYQNIYATGCVIVSCETNELTSVQATIANFIQAHPGRVGGITTTSEFYVETVAALAHEFDVPTNSVQMIRMCRDKAYTRQFLTESGFLQPQFMVINQLGDTRLAVRHVGLPCVVKPCDDTGSYGVKLCYSLDEVEWQVTQLLSRSTNIRGQPIIQAVLCEEYIDAPEFSVETFAWQGEIICVGITEKIVTGLPYFIESGHIFPAVLSPELGDTIESTTREALQAMGNTYGPIHTEVKLTSKGCIIIEINPRLAGGMIPELVWQARGIDLIQNQLKVACGQPPVLSTTHAAWAGIYFFTTTDSGSLAGIDNLELLCNQEDVIRVQITAPIGKRVSLPQSAYDRLGYAIIRSNSPPELITRLTQVQQEIKVVVNPEL